MHQNPDAMHVAQSHEKLKRYGDVVCSQNLPTDKATIQDCLTIYLVVVPPMPGFGVADRKGMCGPKSIAESRTLHLDHHGEIFCRRPVYPI
jgi:hypothetical protein